MFNDKGSLSCHSVSFSVSLPRGRYSWKSRSRRRRCGPCRAGFAGTWCGRRSARWCSVRSACPSYSDCRGRCPSPRNLLDFLWSGQSEDTQRHTLILHIAAFTFQKETDSFPVMESGHVFHPALPILCKRVCVCVWVSLQITFLTWLILNPKQMLPQKHIVLRPVTHWEFKTTALITVIKKACSGIWLV